MGVECVYGECLLPKNNNRYLWQSAYILIGWCVLFIKTADFNFFQTFLFIAPVFVDILNTDLNTPTLKKIRIIFGVVNAAILIACLLGWAGMFLDSGNYFSIASSSRMAIDKRIIWAVIGINIIVPIVFWIGAPCQSALRILRQKQQILQAGQPREQHKGRGKKGKRK